MEPNDISFEQAFGQLERTVAALEGGNLTLERSIELYEEGMQLVRHCTCVLDRAELRVRQLTPDGDVVGVEL